MDLGAYQNIENLEEILVKQNIEIPRLRGLRLMKEEEPVTQKDIDEMTHNQILDVVKRTVEYGTRKDILVYNKTKFGHSELVDYHWNKIHGKKRKLIKYKIKQIKKAVSAQWTAWNNYCGKDVLYVHARIGGGNWTYFKGPQIVATHPDFLCKVDDYWDCTYCDIYFTIKD